MSRGKHLFNNASNVLTVIEEQVQQSKVSSLLIIIGIGVVRNGLEKELQEHTLFDQCLLNAGDIVLARIDTQLREELDKVLEDGLGPHQ